MAKCKAYRFEPFPFLHCLTKLGKVFLKQCFTLGWCLRLKMSSFAACVAFPSSPKIISLHAFPPSQMKTTRKHESFPFKKVFRRKMRKMQNALKKEFPPDFFSSQFSFFTGTEKNGNSPLPQKHIKPQSGSLFSPSLGCGDGWLCGLWMEPPRFLGLVHNPKKGRGGERRSSKTLC